MSELGGNARQVSCPRCLSQSTLGYIYVPNSHIQAIWACDGCKSWVEAKRRVNTRLPIYVVEQEAEKLMAQVKVELEPDRKRIVSMLQTELARRGQKQLNEGGAG